MEFKKNVHLYIMRMLQSNTYTFFYSHLERENALAKRNAHFMSVVICRSKGRNWAEELSGHCIWFLWYELQNRWIVNVWEVKRKDLTTVGDICLLQNYRFFPKLPKVRDTLMRQTWTNTYKNAHFFGDLMYWEISSRIKDKSNIIIRVKFFVWAFSFKVQYYNSDWIMFLVYPKNALAGSWN